jgi:mannose/fructose/N-acetylgalactosamine-specific phosphotransferase system component IID
MNRQTIGGIVLGLANMVVVMLAWLLVPKAWFWTWVPFAIVFAGLYMTWCNRQSRRWPTR